MRTMYRDMTDEQRLAWGRAELAARKAELTLRTAGGLIAAQRNAKARRNAIGASASAASAMVADATREIRRAEMRGAGITVSGSPK